MVSLRKKKYMRRYNQRPEVKLRKSAYMRKLRLEQDREKARRLVLFLAEQGYDNWAEELAMNKCPEMLLMVKQQAQVKK